MPTQEAVDESNGENGATTTCEENNSVEVLCFWDTAVQAIYGRQTSVPGISTGQAERLFGKALHGSDHEFQA